MKKVVFFDRDGVLVKDPEDYRISAINEIELFNDSISALKTLNENGFSIIIITNQAGIDEGLISEEEFWLIHNEILARLKPSNITVLKTYMNTEKDKPDASEWRKPGPNMLFDAAKEFELDLSRIYMIGDNRSDIEAARRAGCKGGILVKTATNKNVVDDSAVYTAPSLTDAVDFVLQND